METVLDRLDDSISTLRDIDLHTLTVDTLALMAVRLQRSSDRLRAVHALVLVEADRARVYHASGARNTADWLANQTNTSVGDAAKQLKLGGSLERSESLTKALDVGEISAATADALHAALATPPVGADPDDIVDAVKGSGPKGALEAVEAWKEMYSSETPEQATERRHRSRSVRTSKPVDGMRTSIVTLPTLEMRQFLAAIKHAAGALTANDERTTEQHLADGVINLSLAYARGQATGGRERPCLLIVISYDSFTQRSDQPGRTSHGDWIPADVVRDMATNADIRRVVINGSEVLDLGHSVRLASNAQFQALVVRDGCCRFGDCDVPAAYCDVDHLHPHPGGPTDLINEALWCRHHHHIKHRPGVTVVGDGNDCHLVFPDGTIVHCPTKGHLMKPAAAA